MSRFADTVSAFDTLLRASGYQLHSTATKVVFKARTFGAPIFAIPDVHLCDGKPGDIFVNGNPDKPKRLAALLRAIRDYQNQHPQSSRAIQLGDWFDVWRAAGGDSHNMSFGAIQNAAVNRDILELDAQIGLAHLIGNHDTSFLSALPDARSSQPQLFRLGFWLGDNVYAMHGHQTDIKPPANSDFDQFIVAAATTIAKFVPGVERFEAYIDRLGFGGGLKQWLIDSLFNPRDDPGPQGRLTDHSPLPAGVKEGLFVLRENLDQLASIVHKVEAMTESHGREADVLIVGHSHAPCAAWTDVGGKPLVVIDAGGWVYAQANFVIAAEDTIAVFDIAPLA